MEFTNEELRWLRLALLKAGYYNEHTIEALSKVTDFKHIERLESELPQFSTLYKKLDDHLRE